MVIKLKYIDIKNQEGDVMASYRIFETKKAANRSAGQLKSKYGSVRTFGGFFRTFSVVKGDGGYKVIEGKRK
tara:strand:- start:248 stop:463 length:216 start_codon:yes stop_codon:yes gene_type:complete